MSTSCSFGFFVLIISFGNRHHYMLTPPRRTLSTYLRKFLQRRFFFSVLASRPHENGVFVHQKSRFRKRAPDWTFFLNSGISFSCGRTKTEVFEYDNVIHHVAHDLYFHRFTAGFSRFRHQPLE